MVKLDIRLDEPSIDLSAPCADSRLLSVPFDSSLTTSVKISSQEA